MSRSVLVTGSNRGLGLQLIKDLASKSRFQNVFATCRKPDLAKELQSVASQHSNIHIVGLDVQSDEDIQAAVKFVDSKVGRDGLHLLINNAGVSRGGGTLPMANRQIINEVVDINASSPIMICKAFYRLMRAAATSSTHRNNEQLPPVTVANISSYLGSIETNDSGALYPYRCSKVALNMATKSMAVELAKYNIAVIALHPGWVRTDLGGEKAPLSVEEAVKGMINVFSTMQLSDSGKFIDYDGNNLPW